MGRNRPKNTAHHPLRTHFERKGAIGMGDNPHKRSMIIHNQLFHKEGFGYIYEITYDSPPFYHIFKERYYDTDDGGTGVNYPGDDAFRENDHQWAWCATNLEDAKEILETFENIFK
jgi:hypothetical protein